MAIIKIFLTALVPILLSVTILWLISIKLKNVSIIDMFWGFGFVIASFVYFIFSDGNETRKYVLIALSSLWGLRLSIFLTWRNWGKEEDYRYQNFRNHYGKNRYWWFSFFQVFLLQGFLIWIISAPILAAMYFGKSNPFGLLDIFGIILWIIGFIFEAGGDYQLARFKSNPENSVKVMDKGLWKYTRHPNYFGDAAIWWGFALFSIAAGCVLPILSSILMTWLLLKVSGVAKLEKTIKDRKPEYINYAKKTSSFFPWFPKKNI